MSRRLALVSLGAFLLLDTCCTGNDVQQSLSGLSSVMASFKSEPLVSQVSEDESRIDLNDWEKLSVAAEEEEIPLTLALRQRNKARLERLLFEVSDPGSSKYGQYLSNEEITKLVAPKRKDLAAVARFLEEFGVSFSLKDLAGNKDYLRITVPIKTAKQLLATDFSKYRHRGHGIEYIRADKPYKLPKSIADTVEYVAGVHGMPPSKMLRKISERKTKLSNERVAREVKRQQEHEQTEEKSTPPASFFGETSAHIMVPIAWRGSNVSLLSTIRCRDGRLLTKDDHHCPGPKISAIRAGIFPLSRLEQSVASVNWPEAYGRDCRICEDFADLGLYRGRSVARVCSLMLERAKLDNDTVICHLTVPNVVVGAESMVDVEILYEDGSRNDEAHCAESVSYLNCTRFITPQPDAEPNFLSSFYEIPKGTEVKDVRSTQAVAEFLGEYYSDADLQDYFQTYSVKREKVYKILGPNDESKPGGEASLDIQVIMGVAPGSPTYFMSMGGLRDINRNTSRDNQEPLLEFMVDLCEMENPPLVLSFSYGDDEEAQPKVYTDRMNVEFMKAGLRGLSILFAAGDDGVGGDRVRTGGESACTKFFPEWPTSSPFVTAVGGTMMGRYLDAGEGPLSEAVSDVRTGSIITTGGGFSNRYERPWYQQRAVHGYLALARRQLPDAKYFNRRGRAYPDVSAMATNYMVKLGDEGYVPVGGTSASTPLVAAIVTLLNDVRLRKGQPPLGFLNPLLYYLDQVSIEAFRDVVRGNNRCSEDGNNCCPAGFEAVAGFDAATGIGSPNFTALAHLVTHLDELKDLNMAQKFEEQKEKFWAMNEIDESSEDAWEEELKDTKDGRFSAQEAQVYREGRENQTHRPWFPSLSLILLLALVSTGAGVLIRAKLRSSRRAAGYRPL